MSYRGVEPSSSAFHFFLAKLLSPTFVYSGGGEWGGMGIPGDHLSISGCHIKSGKQKLFLDSGLLLPKFFLHLKKGAIGGLCLCEYLSAEVCLQINLLNLRDLLENWQCSCSTSSIISDCLVFNAAYWIPRRRRNGLAALRWTLPRRISLLALPST